MRAIAVAAVMVAVVLMPAVTLAVDPPWISDETRGMSCGPGYALAKVECAGGYCDNIKLTCAPYIDRPLQRAPARIGPRGFPKRELATWCKASIFRFLPIPIRLQSACNVAVVIAMTYGSECCL